MEKDKSIEDKRKDVFLRLSSLEVKKYNKYIELVKPCVDKILDEIIPKGCWTLSVKMKDKNVIARIVLYSTETHPTEKKIEIDNKHVWDYIVNVKYYDNRKVISLFETKEFFDPITLGPTIYKQLDELYNDEEYVKLVDELNNLNEKIRHEQVIDRWEKLGLTDGLNGELNETVAQLYEYKP